MIIKLSSMARDFSMELINYSYSNRTSATTGHIPRTPPPSPPPPNGKNEDSRVPPLSLEDIPDFLLCKDSHRDYQIDFTDGNGIHFF